MTAVKTEKTTPKRETIEKIHNDRNALLIYQDKTWPSMYRIKLENGGKLPPMLNGSFTSHKIAEAAIKRHLG